jgi:uncharacterized protein DUF4823
MPVTARTAALVMLAALGFGCSATRIESSYPLRGVAVPAGTKVLLLPIADGQERGEPPTPGSGAAMERALRDDLLAHGMVVMSVARGMPDDVLDAAAAEGCLLVLKGTFTEWADNATEWSGKPDVAAFALEIIDPTARQFIGSATIRQRGSVFALTNESPTRFVPELAKKTLAQAFGWPGQ